MTVYSAIHEDREQQNDRQRDADKPEQRTFSETHDHLRCFTGDETRAGFFGSMRAASFVDFAQLPMQVGTPADQPEAPGESAVIRKQLDRVVEAADRMFADAFEIEIACDEVGERAGQQHRSAQLLGERFET